MTSAPDLNVITVINPVGDSEIEIRPTEILQVVLIGMKEPRWQREQQFSPDIQLKALRYETYYCDGFERNRGGNFQVVAHTSSFGALQHHFWFRIDPEACKEVQELKANYNPIVVLQFYESDKNGKLGAEIGRLKVNLLVEKKDKYDFLNFVDSTAFRDPIANEANTLGLEGKNTDVENGYILNPGWDEQVNFECCQRYMMVELAELQHTKAKWRASPTNGKWNGEPDYGVTEIPSRFINGIRVQRFLIKNFLSNLPIGVTKMRLGDVKFGLNDGHPRWDKKIHLFVVREHENPEDRFFCGGEEYDSDDAAAYDFLRSIQEYKPRKPRRVPVKIEELDIKGDLKAGARLIRLFVPKQKMVEIADPQDNSMIIVPDEGHLVIQLYKDLNLEAPRYKSGEWRVDFSGKLLKGDYVTSDSHRQRFFFKKDPTSRYQSEMLTFRMHDKIRKIYVTSSGHNVVHEVKTESPDEKDVAKIMKELIGNSRYDWRTVTSLSYETGLPQNKVVQILDLQEKVGKVKQHPKDIGCWGHPDRVSKFLPSADCRD